MSDHVGGFNDLRNAYGTQVWAFENMADILENPMRYRLLCMIGYPTQVDRVLHDRVTFTWEGWDFEVLHFPGQTEYHMALLTEIDGMKILFSGDSITPSVPQRGVNFNCLNLNKFLPGKGYLKCVEQLDYAKPDLILSAHFGAVDWTQDRFDSYRRWAHERIAVISRGIGRSNPNYAIRSVVGLHLSPPLPGGARNGQHFTSPDSAL